MLSATLVIVMLILAVGSGGCAFLYESKPVACRDSWDDVYEMISDKSLYSKYFTLPTTIQRNNQSVQGKKGAQ